MPLKGRSNIGAFVYLDKPKAVKQIILLIALALMCWGCDSSTTTIGDQVWMKINLDVSNFRNGDSIPEAKTSKEWEDAGKERKPAWCYYGFGGPMDEKRYGKLYNWYAVNDRRGLAPKGWHIPSDAEWKQLIDYLGGADTAITKMKDPQDWVDGIATNESGFSAFPGGYTISNGTFWYIGLYGYWWSSTEYNSRKAWARFMGYRACCVGRENGTKRSGLSVRCLRD